MSPEAARPTFLPNTRSAEHEINELWTSALASYQEETGHNLLEYSFAKDLLSLSSADEVMERLKGQTKSFMAFRTSGHKVLEVLKPIVSVVLRFVDGGAEGASQVAPGGKAILVACGVLLQSMKGVSQLYDAIESLLQRIKLYIERVSIHLKPSMPPSPAVMRILLDTLVQVLKVLAIVTKYCNVAVESDSGFKRARDVMSRRTKDYFAAIIDKRDMADALVKLEELVNAELQMTTAHTNAMTRENQPRIKFVYDSTVRDALRSWLRPPDPLPRNYEQKWQANSCQWFFDDKFKEWEASMKGVYWVYGNAGAGKSVLCSSIIDTLAADLTSQLAYFYFDYNDPEKQDCRGLVSSLVFQLGTCSAECLAYLQGQLSSQPLTYKTLLAMLSQLLCLSGRTFLVVDALDECPEPARDTGLLDFIEHLCNLGEDDIDLRLLFVSRLEPDIRNRMSRLATHSLSFHDAIEHRRDLNNHIFAQLFDHGSRSYSGWSDDLKMQAQQTLFERSNGMFLWVNLQLRYLKRCAPGDVERALSELPSDLNKTYERVLNIFPSQPAMVTRARHVFECVAYAKRRLSLAEVIETFSMNLDHVPHPIITSDFNMHIPDPEMFILEKCPGLLDLVVSVEGHKLVQFIHFSVQEYLTSSELQNATAPARQYKFDKHNAHLTLARICLLTLLDGSLSSLLEYANQYWYEHISPRNADALGDLLSRFLHTTSPSYARWALTQSKYDYADDTALHWGARLGLLRQVERILEHSRNSLAPSETVVRARGRWGQGALHDAAKHGYADIARILLDCGALVDDTDNLEETALHYAASCGHSDVVRVLLEYIAPDESSHTAASRCCSRDFRGRTALHIAAEKGHDQVVRILIDNGALIDDADLDFETPLHYAAFFGNLSVVQVLLSHHKADAIRTPALVCGARNWYGRTALHYAARQGYPEICELLLEHGALVDETDERGNTPLRLAEYWEHSDVVQVISRHRMTDGPLVEQLESALRNALRMLAQSDSAGGRRWCTVLENYAPQFAMAELGGGDGETDSEYSETDSEDSETESEDSESEERGGG